MTTLLLLVLSTCVLALALIAKSLALIRKTLLLQYVTFLMVGEKSLVRMVISLLLISKKKSTTTTTTTSGGSDKTYWVTASSLNCRNKPSTSGSQVKGSLPKNEKITGKSTGSWVQVTSSKCKGYYVSADYLTTTNPSSSTTTVTTPVTTVSGNRQDTSPRPSSPSAKAANVVYYRQGDSRWGSKTYTAYNDKSQTYSNSACGPTSMAMIVATLADKSVLPTTMGEYSIKHGHRTRNNGTAWSFFCEVAKVYGLKCTQTGTTNDVVSALKAGKLAVASMSKGYWTKGGHFICLYDADNTYIYAHDPATVNRYRNTISSFKSESRQYFIISK